MAKIAQADKPPVADIGGAFNAAKATVKDTPKAPAATKPLNTNIDHISSKTDRVQDSSTGEDTYSKTIKGTDTASGKSTTYNQKESKGIYSSEYTGKDGSKEKIMKGFKGNIFDPKGNKSLTTTTDASGKTTSTYGNRKILPGRAKRMEARWTAAQEKTGSAIEKLAINYQNSPVVQKKKFTMTENQKDIAAGLAAGAVSTFATYPVDTITTRKQIAGANTGLSSKVSFKSKSKRLNNIVNRGTYLKNLYKGVGLKMTKNVPGTAITLGTYGVTKRYLDKKFPQK